MGYTRAPQTKWHHLIISGEDFDTAEIPANGWKLDMHLDDVVLRRGLFLRNPFGENEAAKLWYLGIYATISSYSNVVQRIQSALGNAGLRLQVSIIES